MNLRHCTAPVSRTLLVLEVLAGSLVVALVVCLPSGLDSHAQTDVSLARGWQHAPISTPDLSALGPSRIVAGGPGLVVFALRNEGGVGALLWGSADGQTWRSIPSPSFQPGERPASFYAVGRLFLITGFSAVGFNAPSVPRIWASDDEGGTWYESSAQLGITALAGGGDGVIAFSRTDTGPPSTTVSTSPDGLTWRELPQASGVFASAVVDSVAKGDQGLVAGGSIPGTLGARAGIWTSPDGRIWTPVPNTDGVFGDGTDGSFVDHIVSGPQGIVAIGEQLGQPRENVLWVSPDGVQWRREPAPFYEPQYNFGELVAWQGGFVQFSDEGGETVVWASPDGLTWMRVGSDELFGGTVRVLSAASFQGGVVAFGTFALHPRPACLRTPGAEGNDLRTFQPAVFLWSSAASQSAAPPAIDPADPRALKLLPSDGVSGPFGAYVNLCAADPALGRHRAYQLFFSDPYPQIVGGYSLGGKSLSIVAASASASRAGFSQVDQLLGEPSLVIQQKRELPASVRIGEETRVFRLHGLLEGEGAGNHFRRFAVAWRKGRIIGIVIVSTRREAVLLAERQLAHLEPR